MNTVADYWSGFATHDSSAHPELWDGCVMAWAPRLGPSGIVLPDWSGIQRNGALTNMDPATDWVSDAGGGSLDFDGTDDVVFASFTNPTLPVTLSCWARSTNITSNQYVMSLSSSSDNDPNYSINMMGGAAGDFIRASHEADSGTSPGHASSIAGYVADTWYHIAAVFRSSSSRSLYVNGVFQATNTTSVSATTINRVSIGTLYRLSPAAFLSGRVSEAMVHGRALDADEIRTLAMRPGIMFEPRPRRRRAGVSAAAATRRHLMLLGVGR